MVAFGQESAITALGNQDLTRLVEIFVF